LIVPEGKLRQAFLHEAHDSVVSGNLDLMRPKKRLRNGLSWPQLLSELKAYVITCNSCQRKRRSYQKLVGLLQPHEIPTERFKHVYKGFFAVLLIRRTSDTTLRSLVVSFKRGKVYQAHSQYIVCAFHSASSNMPLMLHTCARRGKFYQAHSQYIVCAFHPASSNMPLML
jgi:Integrase zinc binding domain